MEVEPTPKLILITNPGSSSRKYALYCDSELVVSMHFEFEDGKIICTLKDADGVRRVIDCDFKELSSAVANIREILETEDYVNTRHPLDAIVARIVAPSDYFATDHIVDEDFMAQLEIAKSLAPLHVPAVANEIEQFRRSFKGTPIIAVSDSAFHWDKPDLMKYYPIDTEISDKYGIKRYGYHGLSVASVVQQLKEADLLPDKLIVAHVGSGSSISAVFQGHSLDTSMGYTPLEGLMMATRSGSMDVAAALALGRALKLDNDTLERYLNKKAGLLAVSGLSDDMRDIIQARDEGDPRATFAHALYVYRIQSLIGQMAASLDGADAIVFTATILERSDEVRKCVAQKLGYLGFTLDLDKNANPADAPIFNIAAEGSKPIYIVRTDETRQMARRAITILSQNE